jgi:hypothetical protein
MAKVSGPLMSMDARGKFGGTIVFSGWKGRPTVRQLVTPSNPQSANQQIARNIVRVGGAAQHFANLSTDQGAGRLITDKAALQAAAPSGQAWNGTLVKAMTGAGQVNYDAAVVAYTALTGGEKTTWDNAAAGLAPAFPAVNQVGAGGVPATPMVAGKAFFIYQYGLYILGIAAAPGAVPPVYA